MKRKSVGVCKIMFGSFYSPFLPRFMKRRVCKMRILKMQPIRVLLSEYIKTLFFLSFCKKLNFHLLFIVGERSSWYKREQVLSHPRHYKLYLLSSIKEYSFYGTIFQNENSAIFYCGWRKKLNRKIMLIILFILKT